MRFIISRRLRGCATRHKDPVNGSPLPRPRGDPNHEILSARVNWRESPRILFPSSFFSPLLSCYLALTPAGAPNSLSFAPSHPLNLSYIHTHTHIHPLSHSLPFQHAYSLSILLLTLVSSALLDTSVSTCSENASSLPRKRLLSETTRSLSSWRRTVRPRIY